MNLSSLFQSPPLSDWLHLLLLFCVILILIMISEIARKYLHWPQEVTRKIVHISVGLLLLSTPLLLETALPLLAISAFFTLFNFIALQYNLLPGIHIERNNYGTVYYAFSFFVLILLFWEGHKVVIIASMMIMAVGDALAAIVGKKVRKSHAYRLVRDQKTLEGSLTMFLVSTLVVYLTFLLYPDTMNTMNYTSGHFLLFAVITAVVSTSAEALGDRGNDNLTVPLLSGFILYFLLSHDTSHHFQLILGMVMGAVTVYLSHRARFLTSSGMVSAFLLATVIYGFGGWKWTLPILTFFISSSLLSKVGKSVFDNIFEKGSRRDHVQVMANGGIAGLFMILEILVPHPINYLAYLGSLAAATADTWATEIGMRWGKHPRLISNLKLVPPGTSGGITSAGLLGALAGSIILAISGILFFTEIEQLSIWLLFTMIVSSGFMASLVDSFLGATIQVQFQCDVCQKMTEKHFHCEVLTIPISGILWFNNDVVNFLNTLSGAFFVIIILQFLLM
ncbi:MAG: DUF92 domain-containing protein [bacterium]|nr:MAG: DUF92 domain-containing protein [bacterium]